MRVTKRQLQGIIREELVQEGWLDFVTDTGAELLKRFGRKKLMKKGTQTVEKAAEKLGGEQAAKMAKDRLATTGKVAKGGKTAGRVLDAMGPMSDEAKEDAQAKSAIDALSWIPGVSTLGTVAKAMYDDVQDLPRQYTTGAAKKRTGTYPVSSKEEVIQSMVPYKTMRHTGATGGDIRDVQLTTGKRMRKDVEPLNVVKSAQATKDAAVSGLKDMNKAAADREARRAERIAQNPFAGGRLSHPLFFGEFETGIKENKVRITKRQLQMLVNEAMGMSHGGGDPQLATMDYKEWAEDYMGTRSHANSSSVLATYVVDEELSEDEWLPIALEMGMSPRDVGLEVVSQQREYDAGGTLSDEEDFERGFYNFGLFEDEGPETGSVPSDMKNKPVGYEKTVGSKTVEYGPDGKPVKCVPKGDMKC